MELECCRDIFYATHKELNVSLEKEASKANRIINERNDVIARQAVRIAELEKDIGEAKETFSAYREALRSVEDSVIELCKCLVGCVDREKIDEVLEHAMGEQTEDLLRYIASLIDNRHFYESGNKKPLKKSKSAND